MYQITRMGLIVWVCLIVFISAWTFFLGVLMGRGTAPISIDFGGIETELAASKAAQLAAQREMLAQANGSGDRPPDVEYPEILREKTADPELEPVGQSGLADRAASRDPKTKKRRVPEKPKVIKYPVPNADGSTSVAMDRGVRPAGTASQKGSETRAPIVAAHGETTPSATDSKVYTLQALSVRDQVAARKMVAILRNKGFPAFLTEGEIPGKGTWYRVRIGSYENRTEAGATIERLQAEGIQPLLIRK
jgi:cell division protein FtsN